MSTRDELANLIDDAAEWATSQGRICSPHEVADAILAAGYVKADGEEWGARLGDASGVSRMPGEFQAQTLAELPNWVAVRRSVGHGPWEVA
ncbi:hypothetical protein MWT96_20375 [Prescottella equi]|uniref:hypothetical protein n=1 Tax=Rhodococcus hoagii TaxID=43767 RepID=UPI0019E2C535|nr:hypothetical protein [Prescottella equi]NKT97294.1 hypothetical protein [Prescottella equi]UPH36723.1 hypothetical protein GS533_001325 [Prescottella equi]UPH40826.1 hypothetical protein MWT96_20375 [Prescottella equi]